MDTKLGSSLIHSTFINISLVLVSSLLFTASSFAQSHTRSEWINKYDSIQSTIDSSAGYSNNPDSAVLAWAESYILRSYLNMYETTQNTVYLDEFVTHVDNMINCMEDTNNDSYYGWSTCKYSVNLARNGDAEIIDTLDASTNVPKVINIQESFETPDSYDPTLPAGWTRWLHTNSSTAYLDNSNADTGIYGLTIENDISLGWQVLEKTLTCETGKVYLVEFRGKVSGAERGCIAITDTAYSTIAAVHFNNSSWENHRFVFKAPFSTLKLRLYQADWSVENFAAHFDNVTVSKLTGNLLPEYWIRWQSTANTAFLDYNNKTTGNSGITVKTNPAAGWQVLETPLKNLLVNDNHNYEPGIKYNVSFKAKTSSSSVPWRFEVRDFSTTPSQTLLSVTGTNTEWPENSYNYSFVAPTAVNHDLKVRLYHTVYNVAGSAHFDEIIVNQYAEMLVTEGMIAMPIAKFIMMAYQGLLPSSYSNSANDYLALLEDHLIPKWNSCLTAIDSTRSIYVIPDDGSLSGPNMSLPHNQYLTYAGVYALLARANITYSSNYAELSQKLIHTFNNELRTVAVSGYNAYEWNYWDILISGDNQPWDIVEDTSHGNIDIAAAIHAYNAGICFDGIDMENFSNTFLERIWTGSTTDPFFGQRIDGSENNSWQDQYRYSTWAWIRLGDFDRNIYDLVKTSYNNIWNSLTSWDKMLVISEIIKGAPVIAERFETTDYQDTTLPFGWTRVGSTSSNTYIDSNNAFEGANGLTIKTNGTSWPVIEKAINYTAGAVHQVKFMGKISGNASISGRIHIYDYTTATTIATVFFSDTDWKQGIFTFTAPATAGNNLKIRLYTSAYNVTDGIIHLDNVEIREID